MKPEQRQNALDWVAKKNEGRGCPVCGKSVWKVQFDGGVYNVERGTHAHVIPVICRSCGLFLLFGIDIAHNPIDRDFDEEDEA